MRTTIKTALVIVWTFVVLAEVLMLILLNGIPNVKTLFLCICLPLAALMISAWLMFVIYKPSKKRTPRT